LKRDHDHWTAEIPNDEVRIHESLKHENIVAVLAYYQIDRRIAVILELCENGSISRLLARTPGGLLTEPVSRRYFLQMHAAVTYLHSHGIVHRDVTCDNFLLDARDSLKLSDFGSAMYYKTGDPQFTLRQGSAGYWPPEVLEHKPFNPRHVDVWCLGVCLHVLLTSRLPFTGDCRSSAALDEDECLSRMQKGVELTPTGVRSVRLSAPAVELLRGLLHYVTEVRYSLNRIACCDWINGRPGPMLRSATSAQLQKQSSAASGKPFIGNFYLIAKPQKYRDSPQEKALKDTFGI
jgi:serine/threonine protein kinase